MCGGQLEAFDCAAFGNSHSYLASPPLNKIRLTMPFMNSSDDVAQKAARAVMPKALFVEATTRMFPRRVLRGMTPRMHGPQAWRP